MLGSNPDQQVEDGLFLFIERWFPRGQYTLPELWLIHQVEAIWNGERRIEEELFQWSPTWRQTTFGIDPTWFALSTAARNGISFGKIVVKHGSFSFS
jgi:hypothetical protein